jgi:hypothetical protein
MAHVRDVRGTDSTLSEKREEGPDDRIYENVGRMERLVSAILGGALLLRSVMKPTGLGSKLAAHFGVSLLDRFCNGPLRRLPGSRREHDKKACAATLSQAVPGPCRKVINPYVGIIGELLRMKTHVSSGDDDPFGLEPTGEALRSRPSNSGRDLTRRAVGKVNFAVGFPVFNVSLTNILALRPPVEREPGSCHVIPERNLLVRITHASAEIPPKRVHALQGGKGYS